ncbi:uncharacterized protein LOC131613208 [Vicia villosa]|uniref:uncharacterized protein LOC131613208 n=1 Tax=Vicia villosa TaxID=3911 RepID=UPI00273C3590|nr:uncharacterized protein LOC131613208 [Vicia villosa]
MFSAWMEANKTYIEARNLTYSTFLFKFVYDKRYRRWKPHKRGHRIGRLIWVPPSTGELYYLRMMLTVIKGPTCFDDIKKAGGIVCESFRDACFEMGLLNDDKEYVAAINEAKDWGSEYFLRKLFVTMLLSGIINRPRHVWEKTWKTLSDDILYQQRQATNRRDEQRSILYKIMEYVNKQRGGVFFLHGYGRTGKTFIWRTLSSALRSDKKIILIVASSGIASLLLPSRRTSHSKFKIPVPTLDNCTCNIDKDTEHYELFESTDVRI